MSWRETISQSLSPAQPATSREMKINAQERIIREHSNRVRKKAIGIFLNPLQALRSTS
jgi:hypothetical protein